MKESILKSKSFALAVRIVRLYKYLSEQKTEYILSKQVLRSGTSVGAMVCEAEYSESKADFDHKMGIARKKLNETLYCLELLLQTEYNSLSADAIESIKILTTSIKTAKNINN